jgi:CubicO group peptidase (beta-lactamase class C family)
MAVMPERSDGAAIDPPAKPEHLLVDALAAGLGSAAALSIGDAGREIARVVVGTTRRVPDVGATITGVTRFDLASVSKPMATTSLAMALVSRGALDLGAPVRRWLPDAATTGTVAQLLGHAAGCVAHVEFFHDLWAGRWDGAPDARAALVARAAREPLGYEPGAQTIYSDLGFIMLGAVLERAGGAPLEELFAREVAGPLGLSTATYVPVARPLLHEVVSTEVDPRRGGLVTGVVHDENCHSAGGVAGHAGVFATIDDVANFAAVIIALAAGERRGAIDPDVARTFFTTCPAPSTTWRLGWDTPSPEPGVSHAGDRWPRAGAIGHTGFTGTSLWLDLPRGRWVALLTNRVHPRREGTADAIKALRRAVADAALDLLDGQG